MRVYTLVDGKNLPRQGSLLNHICNAIEAAGGQASLKHIKQIINADGHRGVRSGKPLTAKDVTDAVWQVE